MAYQKLSQAQEEQVRSMRKAGKTPKECIDFMKTTYNIDVPAWKISYITAKGPDGYVVKKAKKISGGGSGETVLQEAPGQYSCSCCSS